MYYDIGNNARPSFPPPLSACADMWDLLPFRRKSEQAIQSTADERPPRLVSRTSVMASAGRCASTGATVPLDTVVRAIEETAASIA